VLSKYGIESTAIDLNIEIINRMKDHPGKKNLLDFFFNQHVHPEAIGDINYVLDYSVDRILKSNPRIVALSLLIYSGQIFTRWLCAKIRQRDPSVNIVIGGTGIRNFIGHDNLDFCHQLKKLGLIDAFIVGDGDESFIEFIKGNNEYPGINNPNWQKVADLNVSGLPDYTDYDFTQYGNPTMPVCDSRGCIKNCEFCDVIEYWTKFQWRTADSIWDEMLHQMKKYGIKKISFRSALVNGNMKEFNKLLDLMCAYNKGLPKEEQLSWEGYFILRNAKFHTEELWKKLQETNATLLVGVESVISKVRHKMGKTFEDEDIDHNLMLGQKYGVGIALLMIVAYPTETLEDFEYTKQWFRDRKQYANNSVVVVNLSFAGILPGTELARKSDEYGIKRGKLPSIWINQNLKITSKVRTDYLKELYRICKDECGFNALTNEETLENTKDEY
jgi:radical SAM superfamily enzyme YgiQ (UPF0313 family)